MTGSEQEAPMPERSTEPVRGLHHITAIAGDPRENLRFYQGVMGMRLVKKSVNQDDPGTYHLFYADAEGHPGTDLTFFPWPHARPGRPGIGVVEETLLTVPRGSLPTWERRFREHGVHAEPLIERFGEPTLPFTDPHGMRLALVEADDPFPFAPWDGSPVSHEHQVRALHGARVPLRDLAPTRAFLEGVLGFRHHGEEAGWHRFVLPGGTGAGAGHLLDLREEPDGRRGEWGVGTVHHLAWTVDDQAHQVAVRGDVARAGRRPSDVIDRFWFRSVYFPEPGGVLFELATAGPGFAVDEDPSALGERLILPPWLEPYRERIEAALPDLGEPEPVTAGGGAA
jgi:glyoxalase family protein